MSCKNMRRDEYELEKGNNEVHRHDGEEHRLTGNTVVTTWDSLSIRLFRGISNRKILRALPGLERKPGAQVAVDPTSQPAAQQDPRRPHPVVPLHICVGTDRWRRSSQIDLRCLLFFKASLQQYRSNRMPWKTKITESLRQCVLEEGTHVVELCKIHCLMFDGQSNRSLWLTANYCEKELQNASVAETDRRHRTASDSLDYLGNEATVVRSEVNNSQ